MGKDYVPKRAVKGSIGVPESPIFPMDSTDRNRTSPFAFTGNKFEFRMLGSSASVADPNIVLNTIMAESLSQFADKLEKKSEDIEASMRRLIRDTFKKHRRILFNGNGYAPEWVAEAEARGLCNYRTTADAVPHLTDEKNVSLFAKHHVYTEAELISRREIMFSDYVKITHIEASTMLDMAKKEIIPASLSYMKEISETVVNFQNIGIDSTFKKSLLAKISENTDSLSKELDNLAESVEKLDSIKEVSEQANFARDSVIPTMNKVRLYADNLETLVAKKYWPFPTYGEMLFV
jgi:glutamine synthetase